MRVIFLVQGEGRGHLTQAISLRKMLADASHEVVAVMVGKSPDRKIPSFFQEQIGAPVVEFTAPNIIYNAGGRGINLKKTVFTHLLHSHRYIRSISSVRNVVETLQPDVIINFYELFGGLINLFNRQIPVVSVAHQYLLLHSDFTFPPKSRFDRAVLNFNSRLTSWRSKKRLALSFRRFYTQTDTDPVVVPPLIRKEVQKLHSTAGNFFLVYMTHHSLAQSIIDWHADHPEIELRCFWDHPAAEEITVLDENLSFHQINSEKYLRFLSECKALVTTAGFESVCEAQYLGKPVMMVPVPNHFEQTCNALDGVISGAGISSRTFNLSVLLEYLPKHIDQSAKFRNWYHTGSKAIVQEIEAVVSNFSQTPSASTPHRSKEPENSH